MNPINTVNKLDSHTLEVLAKSAPSIMARLAAIFIGLLLRIKLGVQLGVKGFGIISLVNRIVSIDVIIGLPGVRQVIIKEVSIAH